MGGNTIRDAVVIRHGQARCGGEWCFIRFHSSFFKAPILVIIMHLLIGSFDETLSK